MRRTFYRLFIFAVLFTFGQGQLQASPDKDLIPNSFQEDAPFVDSLSRLMTNLLNDFPEFSDTEYKDRLKALSGAIDYRLDPLTKERILIRTGKYRSSTEAILGRSKMYFPIFEEHLAAHDVPHHLKYLAIVESHLNPTARSVASAVGLWQFIPSSGRIFDLRINTYVDERSDTHKASEAAAKLLRRLYNRYGDWALAMAAYNCGPVRVDRAVKRAGSKTFWAARKYLPRETQRYVPFFMAMVYVGEYYQEHQLIPQQLSQDLVLTDSLHIEGGQSLRKLAEELDISLDTLKLLNPSYRRNYVPKDKDAQILVLPARIVAQERAYTRAFNRIVEMQKENPLRAVRRIQSPQDLKRLAKAYRCSVEDILFWNELPADYQPYAGDLIGLREHRVNAELLARSKKQISGISIAALKVVGLNEKQEAKTSSVYLGTNEQTEVAAKVPQAGAVAARRRYTNIDGKTVLLEEETIRAQPKAEQKVAVEQRRQAIERPALQDRSRGRRLRSYGFVGAASTEPLNDEKTTASSAPITAQPAIKVAKEEISTPKEELPKTPEATAKGSNSKWNEVELQSTNDILDQSRSRARVLRARTAASVPQAVMEQE